MHFLRSRFFCRFVAIFFLLDLMQSIFAPYCAMALTFGTQQPEYTSYEAPGATDMVNLLTGDFNFNIPIVEIPGPEGNFSLPLSYHAGITPESEASWVGLGFNINAGSIVRDYNQYPDDASGESHVITVQDLTGVRGWSSSLLGLGNIGWNSHAGHYGYLSLLGIINYGYDSKGTSSAGLIGINVGRDSGPSFNAVQFGTAVMTVLSYGTAAAEASAVGISAASVVAKQAAIDLAIGAAMSIAPTADQAPAVSGYWRYSRNTKQKFLHKNYRVWLDKTRDEKMYGVLYAGNAPTVTSTTLGLKVNGVRKDLKYYHFSTETENEGSASDINFYIDQSLSYNLQNTPTVLAPDNYTVNAPGITGSIAPYRMEFGSVAMPREMANSHKRYAPIPYLNNYKVPFLYEGEFSSSYFHHLGGDKAFTTPNFYYGLDITFTPDTVDYIFNDVIFDDNARMSSAYSSIKRIPQGNNIEWFSNSDIIKNIPSSQIPPQGFIDFLNAGDTLSDRYKFRSHRVLGSKAISPQTIGGYSITSVDGVTFHFALPTYDYDYESGSVDVTDSNKNSKITRTPPFANTWLLTAITGADYVDRNSNGLADDGDWGYWVNLNYGKHSDSYFWRTPYKNKILDPSGAYSTYEQGKKELYYLNSIETRSHVGLFLKSAREDGKSADSSVVPLKLDEICLLQKEQYKRLLQAPYNIAGYSNKISNLCMSSQYTGSDIRDFVNRNCEKRILFNYGYDLCKNTPNAGGPINTSKGKLTLKSVSVRGRNDLKAIPDFKFEYAQNPDYNSNYWDGWGMYNPTTGNNHQTNDASGVNGTAWSLTSIGTPLGGQILVNYERDSYSSISGDLVLTPISTFGNTNYNVYYPGGGVNQNGDTYNQIKLSSTTGLFVGDRVHVVGDIRFKCPNNSNYTTKTYKGDYTISSISGNTITVNGDFLGVSDCGSSGTAILVDYNSAKLYKILPSKRGGNIRVGSIVMRDELGQENKIRYLYTNDDGTSSGVVAQEPDYIKDESLITYDYLEFYKYVNYPRTPVMYGKVTVLNGHLTTDSDYHTKHVFEFETPNKSQFSYQTQDMGSSGNISKLLFKIEDRTSKIGNLTSLKVYNQTDIVSSSQLEYIDILSSSQGLPYQGVLSEGNMLIDFSGESAGYEGYARRLNRTSYLKYPSVLKKTTNSDDGFISTSENLKWDNLTGSVLQRLDKSPLGLYIKTVTKPAYSISKSDGSMPYAEFGSKAYSATNKNMLNQDGASYVYRSDAAGTELDLIGAQFQTWKKDWTNYRQYNGTAYADEGAQTVPIWRKGPAYIWKGDYSRLTINGTYTFGTADDFVPGGSNALWQYSGEIKRFDHYGMPLESTDLNGLSSATKMGYDDRFILAVASNASYNEIAFSSAEDKISGQSYFGGEVAQGSGVLVSTPVHSGNTALSVSSGTYGFSFKSSEINSNESYRVSVWANSTNGKIYYKLNNGTEVVSSAQTYSPAVAVPGMGNWYRIDLRIDRPTSSILEVGVKSISGTVVFDDFRFQPLQAEMNCYVYAPLSYEYNSTSSSYSKFMYVLDNDNLFTKYETDEKGRMIKVYKESFTYGVKQLLESKYNYKGLNN